MKKKILVVIAMIAVCTACLTGCNKQVVDFNLEFDSAYVKIGENWRIVKLKSWTDFEDGGQLQLILTDGTIMVVHSNNCILYKGNLPREVE